MKFLKPIESTVPVGTAPFSVTSTTVVTNLNSDLLDGNHASAFATISHSHVISDTTGLQTALDAKQATLVSGTTIKTINSESLLGSGDIAISGGGSTAKSFFMAGW